MRYPPQIGVHSCLFAVRLFVIRFSPLRATLTRMRRWAPILALVAFTAAITWLLWELSRFHEPTNQGKSLTGLAWAFWELLWPDEMVYRGKPVSTWVSIYCLEPTGRPRLAAVSNLIDLGTNGLPAILQIAATYDSSVKQALLKIPVAAPLLRSLRLKAKYERWCSAANDNPPMAVRAFILMGRRYDHRIAVPGLVHLLETSDNPKSRLAALAMLGYIADSASNAVPAITVSLKDKDTGVQVLAREVLYAVEQCGWLDPSHTTQLSSSSSPPPSKPQGSQSWFIQPLTPVRRPRALLKLPPGKFQAPVVDVCAQRMGFEADRRPNRNFCGSPR